MQEHHADRKFEGWLASQRQRNDMVARFANDAVIDWDADQWTSRKQCINDLETRGASQSIIDAAHQAWDEFEELQG